MAMTRRRWILSAVLVVVAVFAAIRLLPALGDDLSEPERRVVEFIVALESGKPPPAPPKGQAMRLLTPAIPDAARFKERLQGTDSYKSLVSRAGATRDASPFARVARIILDDDLRSFQLTALDLDSLRVARGDGAPVSLCEGSQPFCRRFVPDKAAEGVSGRLVDEGNTTIGRALFSRTDRATLGIIWVSAKTYLLRQISGSVMAITTARSASLLERDYVEYDRPSSAPARQPPPKRLPTDTLPPDTCKDLSTGHTINVLVAFTSKADKEARAAELFIDGMAKSIQATSVMAFDEAGIDGRLKLETIETRYTEKDNLELDYIELKKPGGKLSDVHAARKRSKADVVVLVVDRSDPRDCGAAKQRATKDNAFAVVHWKCMEEKQALLHELGHLMGAHHDVKHVGSGETAEPPYAHGHVVSGPRGFATIMAYRNACEPCGRLPSWSNPYATHKGYPLGVAGISHDACIWRERFSEVSGFDGG